MRAALCVFDTATSCTRAGSRPAARAAAATRACTAASPAATSGSGAGRFAGEAGGARLSAMTDTSCLASFADFLAPVTVEQFRREHLDRAPLHLRGTPQKFADVMSWDG